MRRKIVVGSSSTGSCELRFSVVNGKYTGAVAAAYQPYKGRGHQRYQTGGIDTTSVSDEDFEKLLKLATGTSDDGSVIEKFNEYVRTHRRL